MHCPSSAAESEGFLDSNDKVLFKGLQICKGGHFQVTPSVLKKTEKPRVLVVKAHPGKNWSCLRSFWAGPGGGSPATGHLAPDILSQVLRGAGLGPCTPPGTDAWPRSPKV